MKEAHLSLPSSALKRPPLRQNGIFPRILFTPPYFLPLPLNVLQPLSANPASHFQVET